MVLEFDEKGKYFTEFISKDPVLAYVQTLTHYIRGYIHVRKDERLSDEINQSNIFLAVTGAEIYNPEGEILYTCDFMVINREQIIWLMPIEEHEEKSE